MWMDKDGPMLLTRNYLVSFPQQHSCLSTYTTSAIKTIPAYGFGDLSEILLVVLIVMMIMEIDINNSK